MVLTLTDIFRMFLVIFLFGILFWFITRLGYYDPNSKEIKNASPGTISWFHEHRHRQQLENKVIYWCFSWFPMFTVFGGMFSLAMYLQTFDMRMFIFAGWSTLPYLLLMVIMEVDAWIYPLKKKLRNKKFNP